MTPYERELQRVTVLQNAGNACLHCGGWGYTVPPVEYVKEPCAKCESTRQFFKDLPPVETR